MSSNRDIELRLAELTVKMAELATEFRGFAISVRRSVDKLVEENEKNSTFRERAMGAAYLLGSATVVAVVGGAIRLLLTLKGAA
jgi:hypothetical protein